MTLFKCVWCGGHVSQRRPSLPKHCLYPDLHFLNSNERKEEEEGGSIGGRVKRKTGEGAKGRNKKRSKRTREKRRIKRKRRSWVTENIRRRKEDEKEEVMYGKRGEI